MFYQLRQKMKKVKLFIIKKNYTINKNGEKIEHTLSARPCAECIKLMRYYGIKKVYYTTENDNIIALNINHIDITTEFVSDAQKLFLQDKHWIN